MFRRNGNVVWLKFCCLQDMTVCAACAPPGGGRNPVTPRFVRHFSMLCVPAPSEHSLKQMFSVSDYSPICDRYLIDQLIDFFSFLVCG